MTRLPWSASFRALCLLLAALPAAACPEASASALTLAAAAQRAVCLSPVLAQSAALVRQQRGAVAEREAAFAPGLSLSGGPSASLQRMSGRTADSLAASAALQLSHTLADGGAPGARVRQAAGELRAREGEVQAGGQDELQAFIRLWADARDADAALAAGEAELASAQASLRAAQARYDIGVATTVDVLSARSTLAQAERELLVVRTSARKTIGLLAQRLGWSADTPLTLTGEDLAGLGLPPMAAALSMDQLAARLPAEHPQLQAQHERVLALQHALDAVRADAAGTLALTGQLGPTWSRGEAGTAPDARQSSSGWSASVGLTWSRSFGDGGARQARIAQALAQLEAGQAQARVLLRSLTETLWQAFSDWRDAQARLEAAQVALDAAAAAEAAQRGRYQAGVGTLGDWLRAQADLAASRRQAAQSVQQRLRAAAALLHATGRLQPLALAEGTDTVISTHARRTSPQPTAEVLE